MIHIFGEINLPMSTELTIRPRIRLLSPIGPDELSDNLADYFNANKRAYFGYVVKHHAVVQQHDHEVHLWSPRLEVDLEAHEDGSIVRGFIAPRPGVWSFLLFMYGAFGLTAFFSLMVGLTYWSLDKNAWPLYVTAGCLLVIAAVYFMAQGGKKLVHEEMVSMKQYLLAAVGECTEIYTHDHEEE
ncbi:MAG: hypothetical protein AB8F95_09110 [Bacteroidia bacterium]